MTNFNEGPRDPVNLNRPSRESDRNIIGFGRSSSAVWIVAAAIIIVLIVVIARMSIGSGGSDMVEQRAAAPENETTSGKAPIAPATPATSSDEHTLSPQPGAKP